MTARRAVVLAAVATAVVAWPPTRRWIASVLIDTGIHLDRGGADPGPTPEQAERMHRDIVAAIAREAEARGHGRRNGSRAEPI